MSKKTKLRRGPYPRVPMRPRSRLPVAIAIAAVWGAAACANKAKDASGDSPGGGGVAGGERAISVLTTPVTTRDVPIFLEGIGSVVPLKTVMIKSQVDGVLDRVNFQEGKPVRQGDLLAQIDPRPYAVMRDQAAAALARDQAQVRAGRVTLGRYETVRKENLIAQQQVDDQHATVEQLEATIKSDQAQLEHAKLQLDYARIKAPIDGVTGVRLVDPGNVIHASDPSGIVLLTQLDPIAVLFTLPQDELPRIAERMAAGTLRVDVLSRDGQTTLGTGTLSLIDNQINQTTASIRLKAVLGNPQRTLWPNQFVKARLLLSIRNHALVLPAAAIQRGPQGTFVYAVDGDQKAVVKTVKVDSIEGETAVLAGGLEAGAQVVIEGQAQLRPGARVAAKSMAERGDVSDGADDSNGGKRGRPVGTDDGPGAERGSGKQPDGGRGGGGHGGVSRRRNASVAAPTGEVTPTTAAAKAGKAPPP